MRCSGTGGRRELRSRRALQADASLIRFQQPKRCSAVAELPVSRPGGTVPSRLVRGSGRRRWTSTARSRSTICACSSIRTRLQIRSFRRWSSRRPSSSGCIQTRPPVQHRRPPTVAPLTRLGLYAYSVALGRSAPRFGGFGQSSAVLPCRSYRRHCTGASQAVRCGPVLRLSFPISRSAPGW